MLYQTFVPSSQLSAAVRHFWVAEANAPFTTIGQRTVPRACPLLVIFETAPPQISLSSKKIVALPNAVLLLPRNNNTLTLPQEGGVKATGVELTPHGCIQLLGIDVTKNSSCFIDMEAYMGNCFTQLQEQIYAEELPVRKVEILSNFLINNQHIHTPAKNLSARTQEALHYILEQAGRMDVSEVAETCCTTLRNLQRDFKKAIGLSPKQFISLVRFNNAFRMMVKQPHQSLESISYECGYYDPSHLIKDFRKFMGVVPSHLKAKERKKIDLVMGMA
ncbi:helix-turn-helix domain-containing protein [Limibacter armeniacum]|uniref:helix-turn-helix domain-containing protein n=1 Tax=Limibacter armeniacum TaxID=466084 RepID=UPI002FE54636